MSDKCDRVEPRDETERKDARQRAGACFGTAARALRGCCRPRRRETASRRLGEQVAEFEERARAAPLTATEIELVAIAAAIGSGCAPCTRYHVTAALREGLTPEEVSRAIEEAQAVRTESSVAAADVGRRALGVALQGGQAHEWPKERAQALIAVAAAAGCNGKSVLGRYLASARDLEVSVEELRAAVEIADVVKQHAGEFFRHAADAALSGAGDGGANTRVALARAVERADRTASVRPT